MSSSAVTSNNIGRWVMWPSWSLFGDPTDLASEAGTIGGALKLTGFYLFNVAVLYLLAAWALRERRPATESWGQSLNSE